MMDKEGNSIVTDCKHSPAWETYPTVSVLLLNWNGERFLRPCLSSLLRDVCRHVEILLVDNGSIDGSLVLVRKEFPWVRIIEHGSNLGFSQGYNAAVPYTQGRFLVFLNNDTVVEEGWLDPLVDRLLGRSEIGITTSKLLFLGTRTLNCAGGYLKLWTGSGELGFGQDENFFPASKIVEPFYASGAAMAIRRDLFQRFGGFDPNICPYGEDLDLSWRLRLAGYSIRFVPESVVYHHASGTWGVFNPRKLRMVTHHQTRAMIKNLSMVNVLHAVPAYITFAFAKGIALSIVKRNPAFLTGAVLGLVDSFRALPKIRKNRRAAQKIRVLSDYQALKSEGFGLIAMPWDLWKILRSAQKISQQPVQGVGN